MERSEQDQKVADQMYDKLRDDLLKRDLSNTEGYDKAILTLSSASLGFSLSIGKFIVPLESAEYLWILITSWVLLVACVGSSLIAYLISNKAIEVQLDNAFAYYKENNGSAFVRKNRYLNINKILNRITGIFLSSALVLIVVFVTIQMITGDSDMSENEKNPKDLKTNIALDSANVPKMMVAPGGLSSAKNSANIPRMEQVPTTSASSKGDTVSDATKK